jgi:hypothetical protein
VVRLLDHLGLVVRELEPAREAWRRLGFAPTEPKPLLGVGADGAPVPLGQVSCHVVFAAGYVELTAVAGDDPTHHLARYRGRYEGLHILAYGAGDVAAVRERAAAAGLAVTPVMHARRAIEYGARRGDARFRWCMLDAAQSPEALVCVVEHETPELVFQPEVTAHPNGAIALEGATLVVAAPEALAARHEALTGARARGTAGRLRLDLGTEWLEIVTPAEFARTHPGPDARPPALPWFALLRVRVRDLGVARAWFSAHGVATRETPDGVCWVPPAATGGAVVEFV